MHEDHEKPSEKALTPPEAPRMVRAVLRSAASIHDGEKASKQRKRIKYFESKQYKDLPFEWDGSIGGPESVVGLPVYTSFAPPISQRKPPAVYPLARIIVERLSNMVFGDGLFPAVSVEGSPEDEEFVKGLIVAAALPETMKHARDLGGAAGEVALSYGFVNGEPRIEVHATGELVVLDWADLAKLVPRHVVKIWCVEEPAEDPVKGTLIEKKIWFAREWCGPKYDAKGAIEEPGAERLYRYIEGSKSVLPVWLLVNAISIGECPVVWVVNARKLISCHGRGDFEGSEGLIDRAIQTLNATTEGTINNAEPTLCLDVPMNLTPPEAVKKGGHNTILTTAVKYLEVSGSSVSAGIAQTDRLRALSFESAHVAMLDPERLVGVQSGEAMKRLMFPTVQQADVLRTHYGRAIVKLLEGLLRLAKRLVREPSVEPVIDEQGQVMLDEAGKPVTQLVDDIKRFRVPPLVRKTQDAEGVETTELIDRSPSPDEGRVAINLSWPEYFPATSLDKQQESQALQAAAGGVPVMSHKTAVAMASKIYGTPNIDSEFEAIRADQGMAKASEPKPAVPQ